jgi:hypothetical protein
MELYIAPVEGAAVRGISLKSANGEPFGADINESSYPKLVILGFE